jgi:hypothetical protein
MRLTFTLTIGDDEFHVDGEFTPGREAPACSNPSSPRYSDCGEAAEFAVDAVQHEGGGNVTLDELARLYAPSARTSGCAKDALADKLLDLAQAEYERLRASGESCDDDCDGGDGAIDSGF